MSKYILIYALTHLGMIYIFGRTQGRSPLSVLYSCLWIQVTLTVTLVIQYPYPFGATSASAIGMSSLYLIMGMLYYRTDLKYCLKGLRLGLMIFVFTSISVYLVSRMGPVTIDAEGISKLHRELWSINSIPYVASITATYLGTKVFLSIMKVLEGRPKCIQFYLAYATGTVVHVLAYFPGSLGPQIIGEGAVKQAMFSAMANLQLKLVLGIVYILLIYATKKAGFRDITGTGD